MYILILRELFWNFRESSWGSRFGGRCAGPQLGKSVPDANFALKISEKLQFDGGVPLSPLYNVGVARAGVCVRLNIAWGGKGDPGPARVGVIPFTHGLEPHGSDLVGSGRI